MNYIIYTHTDSSIKTLSELVNPILPSAICRGWNVDSLLAFKDDLGIANIDRVYKAYSYENQEKYKANYEADKQIISSFTLPKLRKLKNSLIKLKYIEIGTVLYLPTESLNREALVGYNGSFETKEYEAFMVEALRNLQTDIDNYPFLKIPFKDKSQVNLDLIPNFTVWIWSRALSEDNNLMEGTLIDVTPFISNLTTSNVKQGGQFSFDLAPLIGEFSPLSNKWIIKPNSLQFFKEKGILNYNASGDYHKQVKNQRHKNDFYFEKIISENDVVFIRFEALVGDIRDRVKELKYLGNENLQIPISEIPNKIYDMIGLVDIVSQSSASEQPSLTINISGRSLVKLLVDDGCYFTPLNYIPNGTITSNTEDERLRDRIDGKLYNLNVFQEKTIDFSIKFLINALSNMGVTPDSLWSPYGRAKTFKLVPGLEYLQETTKDKRTYIERIGTESFNNKKKLLANSTNLHDEAISLLRENRIAKNFPSETNTEEQIINGYSQVFSFIQEAGESINLANDKVIGWGGFNSTTFGTIEQNKMPTQMAETIYNDSHIYLDSKGNDTKEPSSLKDSTGKIYTQNELNSITTQVKSLQEELNQLAIPQLGNKIPSTQAAIQAKLANIKNELEQKQKQIVDIKVFPNIEKPSINNFYKGTDSIEPIFSKIYQVVKTDKAVSQVKLTYESKLANGIWQIVDLVIDDEIQDRRVLDSTIANESGSIINHITGKICHEPFVEFFTDTIGDKFYMMARKPPYTLQKIKSHKAQGLILNILPEQNISETLQFTNELGYSMYRLTPTGLLGGDKQVIWAYLKAVYFPELADIWGFRYLEQNSNYVPYVPLDGPKEERTIQDIVQQTILDFKFLIETTAYLPFTRQGTLTIVGDRRYKLGTWVRNVESGEIFHIDGVSNSHQETERGKQRTTTLTVSRGMVEENLDMYFNFLDLNVDYLINPPKGKDQSYLDWTKNSLENWKVNKDALNKLLRREQLNRFVSNDIMKIIKTPSYS